MNTAVMTIKTDPDLKAQVQKIAADLGFSLSSLVNAYLKQLARTKSVFFSAVPEEPSEYLIKALKESEIDRKTGRTSPAFSNAADAIAWLEKQTE
ncbi:type II toxin-antitoxin system RelB/DinJ family antitoxin [Candidatus Collierbacteria bacterium]|nr:type II toxin-antitoxin system RelB/DinJ family antitoxin [Candidatus Collierbacteria bacterium]